ncbi:tripartite tricarboxylate transporter substrate binding protein [Rhodoplanes sp. TEM]|uniref:Tripartite tricarboxylate transporter substrate binding protein n=1 Tax=Rhodoplanes tepidamans TaxID=200616 RepID=A0ABT5JGW2_RHOTP|nr:MULTISPECIES: tripartite tricarboxylate transporter substrate binding protein [Rhodoplanes]MDC7788601.1 tripartite tricarboxylate transporter substrate binding protein [Rhodoplanes tepidamans]MDC7986857.1 tripartite tricarboxylate transporter substrate binding protein [Rhodoplanes sp. TEM]MDQ0358584.1 tripartite-type tricarboxylate transporter receptor subunit TctC [Rhodoplanes tepidamans]
MRRTLATLLAVAATTLFAGAAVAQTYPDRPVRVTVPFGAGGVADLTVRIVTEKLGQKLGQRFIIENMPGAGGIASARAALSAPADGYTLTLLSNGNAVSVPLFKSLPYDPVKDFMPISILGTFDFILGVNAASPYKTLADVLEYGKKNPGKLNVGTINVGSTQNLSGELFKSQTGLNFYIVPYRNTPEVIIALLRDDVNVMIDTYAAMKSNLLDNKIRPLATTGPERSEILPDVPTVIESGVKDYDVTSWNALFAPKGTPPAVIDTLNTALREVLGDADVKKRLLELGITARPTSPAELSKRLADDIAKWGAVIEKAGIPKQ